MSHCQLMQGDKMMFDCWAQLTFSIKSIKETFFSHLLILSTWLTLHPHTLESMATMDTGEIFTLSWIDTDRILIANDWAAGSQNNIFEIFANLVNTSKIEPIHYGASSVVNWKLRHWPKWPLPPCIFQVKISWMKITKNTVLFISEV